MKTTLAGLLVFGGVFFTHTAHSKENLFIYYPSTTSAKERQGLMREETRQDDLNIIVFAKFKDFIEEVKSSNAAAVIAPSFFSKYYRQYKPVLQFAGAAGPEFKYLLLSLTDRWTPANIQQGKIGLVEEIDREHLKDFASGLFNGVSFKMVKSVSKPEDLFPLLVFKSADFILISPDNHKNLREKYTTQVKTVTESGLVPFPALFLRDGSPPGKALERVKAFSQKTLKSLGFSRIEPMEAK